MSQGKRSAGFALMPGLANEVARTPNSEALCGASTLIWLDSYLSVLRGDMGKWATCYPPCLLSIPADPYFSCFAFIPIRFPLTAT